MHPDGAGQGEPRGEAVEVCPGERERIIRKFLVSLGYMLNFRNSFIYPHSLRVGLVARRLAAAIGLEEETLDLVLAAGFFHDAGMSALDERIIEKGEQLQYEEKKKLQEHPGRGARIMGAVIAEPRLINAIAAHHEKYDGSGYPRGLKGEAIPLEARLLVVADVLDALCSDRPYRAEAMTPAEACRKMILNSGQWFDPRLVRLLDGREELVLEAGADLGDGDAGFWAELERWGSPRIFARVFNL